MIHPDPHGDRSPRPGRRPAERTPCPAALQGRLVLVVDDDADSRAYFEYLFSACGAHVRTASSVATALLEFDRATPDVLVSDIGMPEHDGLELIMAIRQRAPERGGQTPAIAVTAFARLEDRRRALGSGFQVHVAKPVEPQEILAIVASLLASSR